MRLDPADGSALLVPIAGLGTEGLTTVEVPEDPDETWRSRFTDRFLAEGSELELHAAGRRIGSLVLAGGGPDRRAACLPAARGRALVTAGSSVPEFAFALLPEPPPKQPARFESYAVDNRIRTFGPILAEQLLRAAGESRPYLAQRSQIEAVAWPGDATPAFAATYLINDTLDAPPPAGEAVSLFFLARFDSQRGYYPVWSEVRRYEGGSGKEAFAYLDAADVDPFRIDFVELIDGTGARRLAASVEREGDRQVDWVEELECRAELLLSAID